MKIIGDYHMHTRYSDGIGSVMDMATAAKAAGMTEIAITDHGFASIAAGLRARKIEKYFGDIESARAEMPILIGVESNIVSNAGAIDITPEMRKKFDILLCGIHVRVVYSFGAFFTFFMPNLLFKAIHYTPKWQIKKNTKVVKRALESNRIDVLTHPGRYFRVDVVDIAHTAAATGTLLELNTKRISFKPIDFERMAATGAKFIIGSDAHSPKRVGETAVVEEFLKNCDYSDDVIINLKQTFTEYKGANDTAGRNKKRDTADTKPKSRFWHRWFR